MEEEADENSRELDSSSDDFVEAANISPMPQLSREELEETLEEVKVNTTEEKKLWEMERRKLEEEIIKQEKIIINLEKEKELMKQKPNWPNLGNLNPFSGTTTKAKPANSMTPESSNIIDDLLMQIKELSIQRAVAVDAADDLKEDLKEAKRQTHKSLMESVALKTQIASLEEKVRLLEEDPSRPHSPKDPMVDDPFGNQKIVRGLTQKLEDKEVEVARLTATQVRNDKKIKQLTEDLNTHISLVDIKQKEMDILIQENNSLQKDIKANKDEVELLQKQLRVESQQREDLEKQLTLKGEEQLSLRSQAQDLENKLTEQIEQKPN